MLVSQSDGKAQDLRRFMSIPSLPFIEPQLDYFALLCLSLPICMMKNAISFILQLPSWCHLRFIWWLSFLSQVSCKYTQCFYKPMCMHISVIRTYHSRLSIKATSSIKKKKKTEWKGRVIFRVRETVQKQVPDKQSAVYPLSLATSLSEYLKNMILS